MKVGLNHWNSSITTGGKPERIYNPIWRRWKSSVFILTLFHSLADGDEALIRNWFFWWEGRQLKWWPSDPIARCRCVRRWSSSLRIDAPGLITTLCRFQRPKCVINVSLSISLSQRRQDIPHPPPFRMRGRRVAFPPILWNGAENQRKRDTPHSVYQSSVCSTDLLWNFI